MFLCSSLTICVLVSQIRPALRVCGGCLFPKSRICHWMSSVVLHAKIIEASCDVLYLLFEFLNKPGLICMLSREINEKQKDVLRASAGLSGHESIRDLQCPDHISYRLSGSKSQKGLANVSLLSVLPQKCNRRPAMSTTSINLK
jgi:hypothetical protein